MDRKNADQPTLSGQIREPASILAENRGVDADPIDPDYVDLQKKAGVNVFASIRDFASGLRDGKIPQINHALDTLEDAFKQVLSARALVGAQQNMVEMGVQTQDNVATASQEQASKMMDADTVKVFSDMARNENLLKVSLETNKKLITPSLLDFLK